MICLLILLPYSWVNFINKIQSVCVKLQTFNTSQLTDVIIQLKVKSKSVSCSVVSDSLLPHGLSMEFSRQEYWSGLPFPSPGDLYNPGMEPRSPTLQADSSLCEPWGRSKHQSEHVYKSWFETVLYCITTPVPSVSKSEMSSEFRSEPEVSWTGWTWMPWCCLAMVKWRDLSEPQLPHLLKWGWQAQVGLLCGLSKF